MFLLSCQRMHSFVLIIGTEALRKIFVPVCPTLASVFPQPAIIPCLPDKSKGCDGKQIGRMWLLKDKNLLMDKFKL